MFTGSTNSIERYNALALQFRTECVNACPDRAAAGAQILENIERAGRSITSSMAFIALYGGEAPKLVVMPEYFMTGYPMGDTIDAWRDKVALEIDGPAYEALGAIAAKNDIYLAGNAYEIDPHFPELYFQCCFIIAPGGETILRYRRLISLSAPSPYDVWDAYVDRYGLDGVFPVADTPIGRLAAIASEEILYPEIARCHAMRGAEVFVHSTSEVGSPNATGKEICRRARAIENLSYIVSANSAGLTGMPLPAESTTGMTKIVDYEGNILAEASPGGESMVANATIDLAALRARRSKAGMTNLLSRQPFQAYAESYTQTVFRAHNHLLDGDAVRVPERGELNRWQREDVERLTKAGIL